MKNLLVLCLLPMFTFAQVQIGNTINGVAASDMSGTSVALSNNGSIMAIGAPGSDGDGDCKSGNVRVFQNLSGVWTQIGQDINGESDIIDGDSILDEFGKVVTLSGDGLILAVGTDTAKNTTEDGYVKVYQNVSGVWTQIGNPILGFGGDLYASGISLSNDGSKVAIGVPGLFNTSNSTGYVGVWENNTGQWTTVGNIILDQGTGNNFGYSVDLSNDGNTLVVGAIGVDNATTGTSNSGAVLVYTYNGADWAQVGDSILGENTQDLCGSATAISGDGSIIAMSSPFYTGASNAGRVRIFQNISNSWSQIGTDIIGETNTDFSGSAIALSDDGATIAIGAELNQGGGAGSVRVFQNTSGNWTQVLNDIDATGPDRLGSSVSLSADGSIVAIGARIADSNGPEAGYVKVFDLSNTLTVQEFDTTSFTLYPNPVDNILTIKLDTDTMLRKVGMYSVTGQFISSYNQTKIDLSAIENGIYFLKIETDKGASIGKIIIK